jgi:hypothetical protein
LNERWTNWPAAVATFVTLAKSETTLPVTTVTFIWSRAKLASPKVTVTSYVPGRQLDAEVPRRAPHAPSRSKFE